jgi:hypothetical protein
MTTMPPSLLVPPDVDSIQGFMVDCHGEKWFEDHAAMKRDIDSTYHYQSWSLKTPLMDKMLIKNPGLMYF